MIKRISLSFVLAVSSAASAQVPQNTMTPDQKGYVAYHYCMMHAAMDASKTLAKDDDIFDIARGKCAETRKEVALGQENNKQFLDALDAADAEKKANFPAWVKGVRERRAALEAGLGK